MANLKHPPGPPMTLDNVRKHGVRSLIVSCLKMHVVITALIEVRWSYPAETEVVYFRRRLVCAKCGARGNKIDVRPNWKEAPGMPDSWEGRLVGQD